MLIEKNLSLHDYDLKRMVEDSKAEGHQFVKRLVDEYADGSNKFDRRGESLYVAKIEGEVVGIGGLNVDPYLGRNDVGRVRHLYVLSKNRRAGVGRELLSTIIIEAQKHFETLTLYTTNPVADKLYRDVGFSKAEGIYKASHVLNLKK
ncbi:GNAT family N-acetyltransferase [Paenibacillus sp. SAF-054]|uniref:GNAT family N-acetyltransferase n=1 Tax=unclassified Paenibacillus TaxID=185978 RepID=UPI003F7EC35E